MPLFVYVIAFGVGILTAWDIVLKFQISKVGQNLKD